MLCAIWYHLFNFKNVKKTHGGVLHKCNNFIKSNTPSWVFLRVLKCKNGTKSRRRASLWFLAYEILYPVRATDDAANTVNGTRNFRYHCGNVLSLISQ